MANDRQPKVKTVAVLGRVDQPLADALKDEALTERRSVSAQLNVILAQRYQQTKGTR